MLSRQLPAEPMKRLNRELCLGYQAQCLEQRRLCLAHRMWCREGRLLQVEDPRECLAKPAQQLLVPDLAVCLYWPWQQFLAQCLQRLECRQYLECLRHLARLQYLQCLEYLRQRYLLSRIWLRQPLSCLMFNRCLRRH